MLWKLAVKSRCLPTVVYNILLLLLSLLSSSSLFYFYFYYLNQEVQVWYSTNASAYIQLPQLLVSKFVVHSLPNEITVIIVFSVINGWNCRVHVAAQVQHALHKSEEYFQNWKKGVGTCFIYTERSQVAECISPLVLCQCLLYNSYCNPTTSNALRS